MLYSDEGFGWALFIVTPINMILYISALGNLLFEMHDGCYHTNSEPLDSLILPVSALFWGHGNLLVCGMGWLKWLVASAAELTAQVPLCLHDLWAQTRHQGIWSSRQNSVWVHIKGLLFIDIILQAASPSCAHANGVRYDIFTVLLHLHPVRKACFQPQPYGMLKLYWK